MLRANGVPRPCRCFCLQSARRPPPDLLRRRTTTELGVGVRQFDHDRNACVLPADTLADDTFAGDWLSIVMVVPAVSLPACALNPSTR